MDRKKELKSNIIIFGLGTLGSKLIQFLLVPLYTIYLTTSDYGTADIVTSTVTMLIPFLTLGMGHGILRFGLGKKREGCILLKFSIKICMLSTIILFMLLPIFRVIGIFKDNEIFIPIIFLFNSLHTILSNYCKSVDKNITFALDGIISSLTTIAFSWMLLSRFEMGVRGYLLAILISNFISVAYFSITCNILAALKNATKDSKYVKETLNYSIPLMPNDLAWWIIQMSDRYMITFMCGAAANGVYSMAYKIPGLFNMLVSIFISAFSLSVFKECDSNQTDTKRNYFENTYSKYLALTFVAATIVVLLSQPIAYILIKKEFYSSWIYTAFLLIAFAIGNMEAFFGSILSGEKKTKINMYSTLTGALVNIILNYILIKKYETYGAVTATIIAYFVVYQIRYIGVGRYVKMKMFGKRVLVSLITLLLICICYTNTNVLVRVCSLPLAVVEVILYRCELSEMIHIALGKITNGINKR